MVQKIECPNCGNDDIGQIRYIEEQLIDAEYTLIVRDGDITADLTNCLNRDWDGEVMKKKLRCQQCLGYFDDPGASIIS